MTNFEKYVNGFTPEYLAQLFDRYGQECDDGLCPIYNAGVDDNICGVGSCYDHFILWFNQEAKEQ